MLKVLKVSLVPLVLKVSQAPLVLKVLKVSLVPPVLKVSQAQLVLMAPPVHKA